jgi:hypothetical protein
MREIPLDPFERNRTVSVQRVGMASVSMWVHEGRQTVLLDMSRNNARAIGEALVAEANKPHEEETADAR